MSKRVFITLLFSALILGSLFITSCSSNEITTTVSGESSTITVVLLAQPPEVPHPFLQGLPGQPFITEQGPICFGCHTIPPQHEGWLADPSLCDECHDESQNAVIIEPGRD
ncbi:hypothetical protein ACFLYS_02645 [Chloroflexota bacterium]